MAPEIAPTRAPGRKPAPSPSPTLGLMAYAGLAAPAAGLETPISLFLPAFYASASGLASSKSRRSNAM